MQTQTAHVIPPVGPPARGYLIVNGQPVGYGVVNLTEDERLHLHKELDNFLNHATRPGVDKPYYHLGIVTDQSSPPLKVSSS